MSDQSKRYPGSKSTTGDLLFRDTAARRPYLFSRLSLDPVLSILARMKITTLLKRNLFIAVVLACGMSRLAVAGEATALSLIKDANEYVGKEARDKVVELRSEKSINTLTPNIWYVVFFDPDATFKASEVKFEAGRKKEMKRPMRMLEYAKADKVMDREKIKVDSDEAIKTAITEPLLKNLTLKATQLWLNVNLNKDLTVTGPIWKVRLFAARLRNPNENVDIGDVYVDAQTGKIVRSDLHISRVD
jgi:hypothetical protein